MRIPQNYKYYFIFLISNSHFLCSHIIHLAFEHLYDCDYSSTDRLIYVTSPVQLFFTIYMCLFNILLYTFCYHIAYKLNIDTKYYTILFSIQQRELFSVYSSTIIRRICFDAHCWCTIVYYLFGISYNHFSIHFTGTILHSIFPR